MAQEISLNIPTDVGNLKLPDPMLVSFYDDLKERVFYINFEIDDTLVDYSRYILQWNRDDVGIDVKDRKPIRIMLYSYGGEVDAMWHFIDIINLSTTPIWIYNMGVAMSAGIGILLSGHKRFCLKNSQALIHDGSISVSGTGGQAVDNLDNFKKTTKKLNEYIISRSNIDKKLFTRKQRQEWFLDADEQLKYGIVDEIVKDMDQLI